MPQIKVESSANNAEVLSARNNARAATQKFRYPQNSAEAAESPRCEALEMKCLVCEATWDEAKGTTCPLCKYEMAAADAKDSNKILAYRERFKNSTTEYAPEKRVLRWDKWTPYVGLAIGIILFIFWLRACSTMGWRLF